MPPQFQQSTAYNPFSLQSIGPAASQQWQSMPTGPTYPSTDLTYQSMLGPTYSAYTGTFYTYSRPPPPPFSTVIVFSPSSYAKEIKNMKKLYKKNMKYSENNDNFVHKLSIFHHFCDKAKIPYEARSKTFSSMFKSFAFDYYLANVNVLKHASLDQACTFIRTHFEKPDHGRNNLIKWNHTTLKTVMAKHEGKSTLDCLKILINNLRHLQHGLDFQFQIELFMQNHLITACEKMSACQFACYKFNDTLAGQITDLKNSIISYEKTHSSYASKTYFTYHDRPLLSKSRQRYLNRPPDDSNRSLIPYRPSANREKKDSRPDSNEKDDGLYDLTEEMETVVLNVIFRFHRILGIR